MELSPFLRNIRIPNPTKLRKNHPEHSLEIRDARQVREEEDCILVYKNWVVVNYAKFEGLVRKGMNEVEENW